ncbi:MAG: ABC transporter ATP-binding protein/permease [Coprobacillus sp.]|nr:ABC transporter ATP-binding protein/permease [Coprobacillus sp.]
MKILKCISKWNWVLVVLGVGLIVFQVYLDLKSPEYMQEITVLIETEGSEMRDIWINGGWMLLCCLGSMATSVVVAIISSRVSSDFSAALREKVYNQVMAFSPTEIRNFSTASLITRTTNDITQIQVLITMGFQVIVRAPVTAIWAICKISSSAWQWTLSVGVAVVLLIVIVAICIGIAMPKFRKLQKLTDDVNRVTRENVNGIRVVRAYNAEDYQENKFDNANNNLSKTNRFTNRTMSFMNPSIQMIMNGLSLAIYWIGAYLINAVSAGEERLTLFSEMMVFSSYGMQVVMAFMMLVMIFIVLPRSIVSIRRVNEVLNTDPAIKDGEGLFTIEVDDGSGTGNLVPALALADGTIVPSYTDQEGNLKQSTKGEVEFRNVSFQYADAKESVIGDINFKITQGQSVAIIGATGCGKSTVINLIPRFFDATDGQVLVDGVDVRQYTQHELRDKIGYISQKSTLFQGTIESNINYGDNNASKDDIDEAITVSQSYQFVYRKPEGVESYVAQGGDNFSGGQKQRLSIARGIARKPEILIFDDTFSALDYSTDKKVRKALKTYCADSTRIIVSQRIGTIKDCDQIFVMEDGKIVGSGTHDYLIENCETYKEIALSQLSEEEL